MSGFSQEEGIPMVTKGIEPDNKGDYWNLKDGLHFEPENATNQNVTFHSSNEQVAEVDPDSGIIHAIAKGNCEITVTTEEGNKTATAKVVVLQSATGIKLSESKKEMKVNESFQLEATVEPKATVDYKDVKWESGDETIATVDNTGKVTAVGKGKTKITATTSNLSFPYQATCEIEVVEKTNTPGNNSGNTPGNNSGNTLGNTPGNTSGNTSGNGTGGGNISGNGTGSGNGNNGSSNSGNGSSGSGNLNGGSSTTNKGTTSQGKSDSAFGSSDSDVSSKILPKTGYQRILLVAIVIVIAFAIVCYKKSKIE